MARARPARLPVRVLPAPVYDPPYDEDRPAEWWPPDLIQPLLELPGLPGAGPADPLARQPGQRSRDQLRDQPRDQPRDRQPTGADRPAAASPPTIAVAARFVNTCLEILNGYRPVNHFRALADPLAAATVLAEMTRAVGRLRPATRGRGLVRLRAMRTCEPRPGVAEIALVVGAQTATTAGRAAGPDAGRAWGLAYRLERQHGRWQCTAARLL